MKGLLKLHCTAGLKRFGIGTELTFTPWLDPYPFEDADFQIGRNDVGEAES